MKVVVQKFGGTSVANVDRVQNIVKYVRSEINSGYVVVVVVSAMAGVTSSLLSLCRDIAGVQGIPLSSEFDTVIHSGEIVTAGLTALALLQHGIKARSFCGWQVPITTNVSYGAAFIENINQETLLDCLRNNVVPVVSGFQGVTLGNRITTLGRGGSDVTAAAIGAILSAHRVDIYTDVSGVYTTDPRLCQSAKQIAAISQEHMLQLSIAGAKVLHPRSIEIAKRYNVTMRVISSFKPDAITTITVGECVNMESTKIVGITSNKNLCRISITSDQKHESADIIARMSQDNIVFNEVYCSANNIEMILEREYVQHVEKALSGITHQIFYDVGTITIVGFGLQHDSALVLRIMRLVTKHDFIVNAFYQSNIKIVLLVTGSGLELLQKELHETLFNNNNA